MTTMTIDTGDDTVQRDDVADALLVANNLRYSTLDKETHKVSGGKIRKVQSEEPFTVVVTNYATDGKETFRDARFVFHDEDNSVVYISGPAGYERIVGEIKRARQTLLQ